MSSSSPSRPSRPAPARQASQRDRFARVLAFIDENLDDELTVERLSEVADFSKYHFHRQFSAHVGTGVHKYVRLLRLKRASHRLAFRVDETVTDIALDSGYDSNEGFARAFRKTFGQSPSEFRARPDWLRWEEIYRSLKAGMAGKLREAQVSGRGAGEIRVVQVETTPIAVLEHRGDPRQLGDSLRRFIRWRKQARLPPATSATFNLLYDDPHETPPEHYRFDIAAATTAALDGAASSHGIIRKIIPGGRCAVRRLIGSDDGLGEAVTRLYSEWLPTTAYEPRDFPLYLQRVRFFPDVPEHEAVTDIHLPLQESRMV